ncbi:hypothetical protein GF376_01305 [Candidatus Peregrinibacteria bacterium]|nr:hypothetical protein [Candidatus Peregrinibacteria bacterium]
MKLFNSDFPRLNAFSEEIVSAPEKFGLALVDIAESKEILLFVEHENFEAAEVYKDTVGISSIKILTVNNPIEAAEETGSGVMPIFLKSAIDPNLKEMMFNNRYGEQLFADHHYMPLDEMQLAASKGVWKNISQGKFKLASHPSPRSLTALWEKAGIIEWEKATSNSAAADMVEAGEADLCITTESGRLRSKLEKVFSFGRPLMIFTIGTSLRQDEIKRYIKI